MYWSYLKIGRACYIRVPATDVKHSGAWNMPDLQQMFDRDISLFEPKETVVRMPSTTQVLSAHPHMRHHHLRPHERRRDSTTQLMAPRLGALASLR